MMQLLAGKEYQRKSPHQMWATDASYFRVSLGLLLHGDRDGRLLPVQLSLEAGRHNG